MSPLIDAPAFNANEIYEIQATDPVEGASATASFGGIGVSNEPHQQLANRTAFLYNQQQADIQSIATLNAEVAAIEARLTPYSGVWTFGVNTNWVYGTPGGSPGGTLASWSLVLPSSSPTGLFRLFYQLEVTYHFGRAGGASGLIAQDIQLALIEPASGLDVFNDSLIFAGAAIAGDDLASALSDFGYATYLPNATATFNVNVKPSVPTDGPWARIVGLNLKVTSTVA